MNVGSLFSGIGGMDEGLRRAGFRHVFFAEQDPYRRAVLAARFPGVTIYDDVRLVGRGVERGRIRGGVPDAQDAEQRGSRPPDLLCGGFPCQDLSVAGNRAGLAGARSGLFFEFARVADALRPRWLLVENVPGLLSSQGGRDFGTVLGTLADLGYGLAWRVLDSRYFGVPQRRRRVFIVRTLANPDPRAAAERAGQVLAVGSRCGRHPATRGEAGTDVAVASLSGLGNGGPDDNDGQAGRIVTTARCDHEGCFYVEGMTGMCRTCFGVFCFSHLRDHGCRDDGESETFVVAAPLTSGSHPNSNAPGRRKEDDENLVTAFSHTQGLDAQPSARAWPTLRTEGGGQAVGLGATVRRLTPTECERLQALPDGWTRLDDKTPDSRRYAALGDAVTASVAEWIGRRILAA